MADLKISQLLQANVVNKEDLLYLIQDGVSENVSAGTLFASISDPTFSGNITLGGPAQTLYSTGRIDVSRTRTDLYGGISADPTAIANGSVLPSTIFLYTEGISGTGRGLTFANATPSPFTKTIYVKHKNNKIYLGAAQSTLYSYPPEDWVGPTGLRPFPDGLYLQKGSTYIFDVSDPSNAANAIAFSESIDGTNTLGFPHTANITVNGTAGTANANVVFRVPDVPTDAGGKQYLELPQGTDGQLKIINLVSTSGGKFVITSNIRNNLAIQLGKTGDSAFLMYSGNAWLLIGSNPGLVTTFSGTSDDVPEGSKLYFTNARARAAISAGDGSIIYDPVAGTIKSTLTASALNIDPTSTISFGNIIVSGRLISLGNVNIAGNLTANASISTTGNITAGNVSAAYFTGNGSRLTGVITSINSVTGNLTVSNSVIANGFVFANGLILNGVDLSNTISTGNVFSANLTTTALLANTLRSNTLTTGNIFTNNLITKVVITNSITSNIWNGIYTANVIESDSNLYYTNTRVYSNVKPLLDLKANVVDLTTANVIESASNLYYTNARVQQYLTNVTGTILPAVGNMYDIGSNEKPFRDLWLFGSSIKFSNSGSISQSSNNFVVTNGSGAVLVSANANAIVVTSTTGKIDSTLISSSGITTANIPEGNANIYYSNDRVFSNISLASIDALFDVDTKTIPPGLGQGLIWNGTKWVANTITVSATEFANIANVVVGIVDSAQNSNIANIVLGLVNASIRSAFSNVANIVLSIDNFTTSNLAEGSNLYYTNARVRSTISAGNGLVFSNVTGIIETSNAIVISANVPANPYVGMAWVNSNTGKRYDYVADGDSYQWVQLVLDSGYGINLGDTVTGMSSRTVVSGNTSIIAANASSNIIISGYKGYALYKIQTNAAARVRVYTNETSRIADFSRSIGITAGNNSGVIAEIVTTDANTIIFSPAVYGFSDEVSPSTNISVCVVNNGVTTKSIKIDMTILKLEA